MRPFLQAFQLFFLADVFTWLLLMVIVAGATRISLFLYRVTRTPPLTA
ncbi:MAG: hypothetical protein H0V36_10955 [Chloroflexi bacterium]|nr:hypothetical protein [Chloroflexota bacterium]